MALGTNIRCALLTAVALCASVCLAGQPQNPSLPASANELVRSVVQNELKQASDASNLFSYKQRTEKPRGTVTKQLVETPQGVIGRTVAINDRPLSPEDRKKDDDRINRLLDPRQMRDKEKEQKEDEQRTRLMVRAIPDAFLFEYNGTQPGSNGHEWVKLHFRPNPNFNPPTRETLVFQGMEGELWLDAQAKRIAKIDGTMMKDVSIGWGIIGHLDKGGHFLVEQAEVVPGHWDTTKLALDFTGKALIFKSIRIKSTDTISDFCPVPRMNVAQALDFLRKNGEQAPQTAKK